MTTYKTGLQSGLTAGIQSGLNPGGVAGYALNTLTPAQVATITGIGEPTLMWRGGEPSPSAQELVSGFLNLTRTGVPTHEVDDTALGGLTTEFLDGSVSEAMEAAVGVCNPGTAAFALIWIGRFTDTVGVQSVFAKRDAGGVQNGYELLRNNDGLYWIMDTPTGTQLRSVATAHGSTNAQTILCTRKATANEGNLYSREGQSTGSRNADTIDSTRQMSVGYGRVAAAGQRWGMLLYYEGATAELLDNSHRLLLAQALGYEA